MSKKEFRKNERRMKYTGKMHTTNEDVIKWDMRTLIGEKEMKQEKCKKDIWAMSYWRFEQSWAESDSADEDLKEQCANKRMSDGIASKR